MHHQNLSMLLRFTLILDMSSLVNKNSLHSSDVSHNPQIKNDVSQNITTTVPSLHHEWCNSVLLYTQCDNYFVYSVRWAMLERRKMAMNYDLKCRTRLSCLMAMFYLVRIQSSANDEESFMLSNWLKLSMISKQKIVWIFLLWKNKTKNKLI